VPVSLAAHNNFEGYALDVVPSNSSSGSSKNKGGNGAMGVGEGITGGALTYMAALQVQAD